MEYQNTNQNVYQNAGPRIPEQYKPLSPWAYVGYNLLFMIPLVGLIMLFVFAFSDKNINRRNYARSFFCAFLIGFIISVLTIILMVALGVAMS